MKVIYLCLAVYFAWQLHAAPSLVNLGVFLMFTMAWMLADRRES